MAYLSYLHKGYHANPNHFNCFNKPCNCDGHCHHSLDDNKNTYKKERMTMYWCVDDVLVSYMNLDLYCVLMWAVLFWLKGVCDVSVYGVLN